MTTMQIDRAVVEQALEALDEADTFRRNLPDQRVRRLAAMAAFRAALAEPVLAPAPGYCKHCKQYTIEEPLFAEPVEPVAWLAPDGSVRETPAAKSFGEWVWGPDDFEPLYTAPPQRKPLTKEQFLYIYNQLPNWGVDRDSLPQGLEKFGRAIEQAHGIGEQP